MSVFRSRYRRIQPKLRSIPLRKEPSAIYIQMHQLANERERLQQELHMLRERERQILKRLQELEAGLAKLETDIETYVEADPTLNDTTPQAGETAPKKTRGTSGATYPSMEIGY